MIITILKIAATTQEEQLGCASDDSNLDNRVTLFSELTGQNLLIKVRQRTLSATKQTQNAQILTTYKIKEE